MLLIIGLGNPGLKFRKTRHNIGFMAVDTLQKENNFSKFKLSKKAKAEVAKGKINGQVVFLAKPQTFMNESGFAVKTLISNLKLQIANIIVIHDDFDLPFGKIKIAENSGSGGHRGVESIIETLGTKNFKRLRIGIRPISNLKSQIANLEPQNLKAEDFVLKKFTKDEEKLLASGDVIKNAIKQLSPETFS